MNLFDIAGESVAVAERVQRGEKVLLAENAGGRVFFRNLALQTPGAVVVRVGPDADAHTHAVLSAATQCGPDVARDVSTHLRSTGGVTSALGVLKEGLANRRLLIAGLGWLSSRDDLAKASLEARRAVYKVLRARADVAMTSAGKGLDPQRAHGLVPASSTHWDSQRIWQRCHGDLAHYEVIAALYLAGEPVGTTLPDLETAVRELWLSLAAPLRDLVRVLATHGRPLPRMLLERAQLGVPKSIDAAVQRHIIHDTRGELTLPAYWRSAKDEIAGERSTLHRRLATAFAPLSRDDAWGPLATLEAHRHFAAIPDLTQARSYAAYGVEVLLDLGRRLSLGENWGAAEQAYQVVQTLGDRAEQDGRPVLAEKARAYAIHYEAYNRYKGGRETSIDRTIERYRKALVGWNANALFWSRLIAAYFVASRLADGVRASVDAYAAVPRHEERDHLLTCRTVNRLLDRGLVLEASLAWAPQAQATPTVEDARAALLAAWTASPPRSIWSDTVGRVELLAGPPTGLTWHEGEWHVSALDCSRHAATPRAAMNLLVETLRDELGRAVSGTEPVALERRNVLATALGFPATSSDESVRWLAMLAELVRAELRGELDARQRGTALSLWTKLRDRHPRLRRPAVRISDERTLQLSWSYAEPAGFMFSVDITEDGRFDWYLRDPLELAGEGSETPVDAIPAEVVNRLEAIAR